jgi:hypothetical protein
MESTPSGVAMDRQAEARRLVRKQETEIKMEKQRNKTIG